MFRVGKLFLGCFVLMNMQSFGCEMKFSVPPMPGESISFEGRFLASNPNLPIQRYTRRLRQTLPPDAIATFRSCK